MTPDHGAVGIIVERAVDVPMSDGVILRADIWRPDAPGRFPILLQRTIYGRDSFQRTLSNAGVNPLTAVSHGYVVIVQDARGRHGSDGRFELFGFEASDGRDTIAWARGLPFSNGDVAMFGASFSGINQFLAAGTTPVGLRAIAPHMAPSPFEPAFARTGGAFRLGFALWWALAYLAPIQLERADIPHQRRSCLRRALSDALSEPTPLFHTIPLCSQPLLQELVPWYLEWLRDPMLSRSRQHPATCPVPDVPVLHIAGWYDLYLHETLRMFRQLESLGVEQQLIIGPWAHGAPGNAVGTAYFGPLASQEGVRVEDLQLAWYSRHFGRVPAHSATSVSYFVMGANSWRHAPSWPPPNTHDVSLYLRSSGRAASDTEDGRLSVSPPVTDELPDMFVYDPFNPVPTVGGDTFLPHRGCQAGPRDQKQVETRHDVLVYSSMPLSSAVEVLGPVVVDLYAATSASDTDWTVKLVDVCPDGSTANICDGILRARYRSGYHRAQPLSPWSVERYHIPVGETAYRFGIAHRIRLEVSSSNFPKFERNPNAYIPVSTAPASAYVVAQQRVYHDARRPSRLVLRMAGQSATSIRFLREMG